ncbi:DNA cytosine methyltransferase [Nocardiopsis sp. LOL_012]|uniref:DNA cytosine methyltransferase n=1 Tax=Nocardiopsis sp. LOL_012 TaxID=3345409 RepID=UPI003A8AAED2
MTDPDRPWTVGSLCTGYGGLELGLATALANVRTAWCADPDPHVATILRQRFPGTPNLGDITRLRPQDLDPVDIITAGFPCQDVSSAGRGAGVERGARSGIWTNVLETVRHLGPPLVFLENVEALRWAGRGLDKVLGDLASIGYDARWTCLRASDVGAPHRRERIFVLAAPAAHTPGPRQRPGRHRPRTTTRCRPTGQPHRPHHRVARTGNAHERYRPLHGTHRDPAPPEVRRPTPAAARTAGHAHRAPGKTRRCRVPAASEPGGSGACRDRSHRHGDPSGLDWGVYAPAIHRWERTLGRPSPRPHETGQRGRPRLSPPWVEWLMGLPEGWVTDCGLSRPQQLRALGNGVVPAQAATAFALLRQLHTAPPYRNTRAE